MIRPFVAVIAVMGALTASIGCGDGSGPPPPLPPALKINTASLPNWMATFPYNQTVQASGGVAPFTWNISSVSLPHGLSLGNSSSNSVVINGTTDVVGTQGRRTNSYWVLADSLSL